MVLNAVFWIAFFGLMMFAIVTMWDGVSSLE